MTGEINDRSLRGIMTQKKVESVAKIDDRRDNQVIKAWILPQAQVIWDRERLQCLAMYWS